MCWIARDMDGTLRAFQSEPVWDEEYEEDWQGECRCFIIDDEGKYKEVLCGEKIKVNKDVIRDIQIKETAWKKKQITI